MSDYKLVIFDCDGVLVDSEIISCAAEAEAYTAIGYPISTQEMARRFTGCAAPDVDRALSAEIGREQPPSFRQAIKRKVLHKYRTELQPITGAAQLLDALPLPKCVASSAAPAKLALGLVETKLYERLYPYIYSTALVARSKPAPDIFRYAAAQMQVAPEHCLVVEDSVAGVTAARSAGMRCLGFSGGSHCSDEHGEQLLAAGAFAVVKHLAQVLDHV
ncbi:MAG: HAD family hydrolase [Pseudomonadales bacterium]